jgi:hypothetical protein
MESRRIHLTYTDTRSSAHGHEVTPANYTAARLALRLWIASASFAILYELVGGETVYPALALIGATALLGLALPSGRAVEVLDDGLVRRGVLTTRRIPWDRIRSLRWSRHGGVEKLTARAGLSTITLSSDGDGFADAIRRVRAIASFRNIPITT